MIFCYSHIRMDEELKELLEKNLALGEENNRILRGLRTSNRIAFIYRLVYIVIFAGGAVYAYYYAKPYISNIVQTYQSIQNTQQGISDTFKNYFTK